MSLLMSKELIIKTLPKVFSQPGVI
ncbi:hypothetical protein CCACVL1_01676 [Corchorus capsularis]|uniref:Uncharacterized protein n=1 Tax=Corchorus capsularis TaxID=210143 RepID=A0A1R3KGK0_COCAP|nr:hypothetical protein CCACVL1_01676 [Corchorus capsularis]